MGLSPSGSRPRALGSWLEEQLLARAQGAPASPPPLAPPPTPGTAGRAPHTLCSGGRVSSGLQAALLFDAASLHPVAGGLALLSVLADPGRGPSPDLGGLGVGRRTPQPANGGCGAAPGGPRGPRVRGVGASRVSYGRGARGLQPCRVPLTPHGRPVSGPHLRGDLASGGWVSRASELAAGLQTPDTMGHTLPSRR